MNGLLTLENRLILPKTLKMRRPKKKKSNKKKSVTKRDDEFGWISKISNETGNYIKQIDNRLKYQSLDDIIDETRHNIDFNYKKLSYGDIVYPRYENVSGVLQSIQTHKHKYNILIDMKRMEWLQKPWYVRMFSKIKIPPKYEL